MIGELRARNSSSSSGEPAFHSSDPITTGAGPAERRFRVNAALVIAGAIWRSTITSVAHCVQEYATRAVPEQNRSRRRGPSPTSTPARKRLRLLQPCLPVTGDLDCSDVSGPVTVRGADPYPLDNDGDGSAANSAVRTRPPVRSAGRPRSRDRAARNRRPPVEVDRNRSGGPRGPRPQAAHFRPLRRRSDHGPYRSDPSPEVRDPGKPLRPGVASFVSLARSVHDPEMLFRAALADVSRLHVARRAAKPAERHSRRAACSRSGRALVRQKARPPAERAADGGPPQLIGRLRRPWPHRGEPADEDPDRHRHGGDLRLGVCREPALLHESEGPQMDLCPFHPAAGQVSHGRPDPVATAACVSCPRVRAGCSALLLFLQQTAARRSFSVCSELIRRSVELQGRRLDPRCRHRFAVSGRRSGSASRCRTAAACSPSDDPCERFSGCGTYITSAFQPRGSVPRMSARERPFGRPRPTAAGYSSRSNPRRVGIPSSSRSRARRRARPVDDHHPRPAPADRPDRVAADVRVAPAAAAAERVSTRPAPRGGT